MPSKVIFEYAVVRIVPKVERGEFLNVGIILFAKSKDFLAMKYHFDKNRLALFSEEIDIERLENYLDAWDWICKGSQKGGAIGKLETPERFRWLTAAKSTIIQCSEVHPGLCQSPENKLDRLFQEYVL